MDAPRIAVIGFGMAGIGAVHALRHPLRFASRAKNFRPAVTVFEGSSRPGGKAAPENLGAQFLDADAHYPLNRILKDLGLKTHRVRKDYELVRLRFRNKKPIEVSAFREALSALRRRMGVALKEVRFGELDAMTVQQFLDGMRQRGELTAEGLLVMRHRMLLESGTQKLSALGYALALAKTPTPVHRLEVVGGLHAIAVREREAALANGVAFHLGAVVTRIDAGSDSARVWVQSGAQRITHEFDRVILAVSPEHLAGIRITGNALPLALLGRMKPARITKSNLVLRNPVAVEEHATERYSLWYSRGHGLARSESMATFFHGWESQPPMSMWNMLKIVAGQPSPRRLVRFATRTWDGSSVDGEVPSAYVTEPAPGECVPLLRLSRDLYFRGLHDASPLRIASHALGIGANVREAALTGEWAVVSLLRHFGHDISAALSRHPDPELEMFGAPAALLARELDGTTRAR